jgi:LysR family transcriptional regulator, glycine cleavage system transcriptional activator
MTSNIQSLDRFRTFEVAARHLSFTKAAQELFVTQAAVSQQIRQLEDQLGFKLFHRLTRKLALTEEGAKLAHTTREALNSIYRTIDDIKQDAETGSITISTIPSFAVLWLIPRLGQFRKSHPGIQLNIHSDERIIDLNEYKVDLAIRAGKGNYPGLEVTLLMKENIFPVCSPSLLQGDKPLKTIKDIYNHEILQDEVQWRLDEEETDWYVWLKAAGITDIDTFAGASFSNSIMALQAAAAGLGIAMCRSSLIGDDLETGRLVKPFDFKVESPVSYYIVYLKEHSQKPKIKAVTQWLLEQAAHQQLF